jgi:divalent metal cation (Fe/Co/Zn/Cd) transporter
MALTKGVGGYVFNSQALVADAFHALTDLVSDFMTLATISVALKPPTSQYPNGYGKVESFGSLVVSGLLLTGGILMATHSGGALIHQLFGDLHLFQHAHDAASHNHGILGHSHSHSAKDMIPNLNAAWLAGGSIIIKEWLYRISESLDHVFASH